MEYYGKQVDAGNAKALALREVKLNFLTETHNTYGDDLEYIHRLEGSVKVAVLDYSPDSVTIMGRKKFIDTSRVIEVPFTQLPEDLQQELKYIWGKVEKAIEDGLKDD